MKTILMCLLSLLLCAQGPGLCAQTQDYVQDGVFTQGIEGPGVDAQGRLYAVNFAKEGTIGIIPARDKAALFLTLPKGSTGNGIRFDRKGMMYVADYTGHNILKINPLTASVSVYAHSDQMHQPNDIAIDRNGILYASDPDWDAQTGRIWKIDLQGQATIIDDHMGTANGIEVSTDERHLYVNESVQRKVWQYDRDPRTGAISNKRLLISFPDFGLDGMRCDDQGNLYIARYNAGTVVVVSPAGALLRTIRLKGRDPTNVAFGGADGKTLFITLQDRGAIEFIRVKHRGRAQRLLEPQ